MTTIKSRIAKLEKQVPPQGKDVGIVELLTAMNIEEIEGVEASQAYLAQFNKDSPLVRIFEDIERRQSPF